MKKPLDIFMPPRIADPIVTQESFEPGTVTGRDVDRGIDAEPAGGLPSEHVVGDVAFEQTLALRFRQRALQARLVHGQRRPRSPQRPKRPPPPPPPQTQLQDSRGTGSVSGKSRRVCSPRLSSRTRADIAMINPAREILRSSARSDDGLLVR